MTHSVNQVLRELEPLGADDAVNMFWDSNAASEWFEEAHSGDQIESRDCGVNRAAMWGCVSAMCTPDTEGDYPAIQSASQLLQLEDASENSAVALTVLAHAAG